MIASIFSKSKPINFLIVLFITFLAFFFAKIKLTNASFTIAYILKQALIFFACYGSILILNFIVSRNNLSKNGNFEILLYSLFLASIPQVLLNTDIIMSNLCILFALRRIISLRSHTNVKKKLFDAAVWISIASLFYFWALIFFITIPITLLLYTDNQIKNWIIPFVGLVTVFIITASYSLIVHDDVLEVFQFNPELNFNFIAYNTMDYLLAITILFSFGVWSSIFYIRDFKKKRKKFKTSYVVVLVVLVLAFLIIVVSSRKTGSEFLFLFAPLAIVIANYIENIKENWFKELFVIILVALPIAVLML
jgi:hypothetical protein